MSPTYTTASKRRSNRMLAHNIGNTKARAGKRPRSNLFLNLDLKNAYARLGVSPLASDKEISDRIGNLRSAAVKRLKAKGNTAVDDPDQQEVLHLNKIEEEIGDPGKRRVYDERHPQNILLTVQTSPVERAWVRHRKAGLISNWVQGELGEAVLCPTPSSPRLWALSGLEAEVLEFLSAFVCQKSATVGTAHNDNATAATGDEIPQMISFDELKGLLD